MILLTKEYNPDLLKLGQYNDNRVTFFYPIGVDEYSILRIQTPTMNIPFDPSDRKTKDGDIFIKNISLSMNNDKKVRHFQEKIEETDKKIQELLPEILKSKEFSPSLWKSKNGNYEPTMKINLPYKDGSCCSPVFNDKNEKISEEEIKKGIKGSAILKLDKVWIWNNKIGINWTVEQFKIQPSQNKLKFREE